MSKYYVTMTDKLLSELASGKVSKLVVICSSMEQAISVANAAKKRRDMKKIAIRTSKPYYDKERFITSFKPFIEFNVEL